MLNAILQLAAICNSLQGNDTMRTTRMHIEQEVDGITCRNASFFALNHVMNEKILSRVRVHRTEQQKAGHRERRTQDAGYKTSRTQANG